MARHPLGGLFEAVTDVLDIANDPTDSDGSRAARKGNKERAKIVAWLRSQPAGVTWTSEAIANAIERGDHLK